MTWTVIGAGVLCAWVCTVHIVWFLPASRRCRLYLDAASVTTTVGDHVVAQAMLHLAGRELKRERVAMLLALNPWTWWDVVVHGRS